LRSTEAVRQVLRERDATTQAGFSAESMPASAEERPILFMDGEKHRTQRAKVARLFAPKTVANRYRELMENRADVLVAEAVAATTFHLDHLTLRYSTEVAAQVIGLTNSNVDGMAKRLERLFVQPDRSPHPVRRGGRLTDLWHTVRGHTPMLAFYLADVRPAIAARRRVPAEDVISHLLAEGYRDPRDRHPSHPAAAPRPGCRARAGHGWARAHRRLLPARVHTHRAKAAAHCDRPLTPWCPAHLDLPPLHQST
jgi:cytochrome P450